MNGVTKEVLKGWFNIYKSLIIELKIKNYNTYNVGHGVTSGMA
jgi:hypothetical protein